ncbi:MAG: hypothetical protein U0441_07925 [Polyangiaceae bacterium]
MKRWTGTFGFAIAALATASVASAQPGPASQVPVGSQLTQTVDDTVRDLDLKEPDSVPRQKIGGETLECYWPGYFNGLGACNRTWEIRLDSSFDTNRVGTGRVEIAAAWRRNVGWAWIFRTSMGLAGAVNTGSVVLKGPIVSVGVRQQTKSGKVAFELGLRLIPGWNGPHEGDTEGQNLAFGATLSSGLADDARWLPFAETGVQLYTSLLTRTRDWVPVRGTQVYFGALYGGQGSLFPMKVRTWVGSQTGFIGNVFVDVFTGILKYVGRPANLQVGLHGEVSLSTIWPASRPLPLLGNVYVAWSPKDWISARVFGGVSLSPLVQVPDLQYGLRTELYVP